MSLILRITGNHDGAGLFDEFGPDSEWAYIYDNPEDDAVTAEEWKEILKPMMHDPEATGISEEAWRRQLKEMLQPDDDGADEWKNGSQL